MQLNPYLTFNGQCEEAFNFYAKLLGGTIEGMFRYAGTPAQEQAPAEWHDKIMHASLSVGGQWLMGGDIPSDRFQTPAGFSVSIHIKGRDEGERIFNQLAEGGTTVLPFQQTFWASGFGMCVDRFGIPWMVNCE